ncbi:MAG: T9SS type A sorting domain-containing protein [Saprospiraceae bacterium]|nr:T9SS type A sorting domain-containing protein [Saprospiraceae bacterium]
MRILVTSCCLLLGIGTQLQAQTTYSRVYEIMQEKCVQCHNNADPEQGLDLEGAGATLDLRMQDVFSNIVDVVPANSYAASAGLNYIRPGRPDKSFIFHKINQGLEPTIELDPDMGQSMPAYGGPTMNEVEKEMIRQWILFGANYSGTYVNEDHLEQFYNGGGLASFDVPPPAPAPAEGFQIKMGPFYLSPAGEPGDELEYFQKYALDLGAELDVNQIDMKLSGSSHHFIIYNYSSVAAANNIPDGLRLESFHQNINLVCAVQEATDLKLPEGTAFKWPSQQILDLNSHYINYSAGLVYQAEVYVNIYTQPGGSAAQQMYSDLVANGDIYIPNNGNEVTHTQVIHPVNGADVYLWNIMGHTHKYGVAYKAFEYKDGAVSDIIYDGACAEGIPGCASPFFDYQHIPPRYFEPLRPLPFDYFNGIKHEASWINDGPSPVNFGPTSDDEMMVLVLMYTLDSVGVNVATSTKTITSKLEGVSVSPNPAQKNLTVNLPASLSGESRFQIFDLTGKALMDQRQSAFGSFTVDLQLPGGMYIYQLTDAAGRQASGKLRIVE